MTTNVQEYQPIWIADLYDLLTLGPPTVGEKRRPLPRKSWLCLCRSGSYHHRPKRLS